MLLTYAQVFPLCLQELEHLSSQESTKVHMTLHPATPLASCDACYLMHPQTTLICLANGPGIRYLMICTEKPLCLGQTLALLL